MKVLWHNDWKKDLWFFQRNMHQVFALFLSHPLNIVHKFERAYIYVLLIILAILLSTAKTLSSQCYAYDMGTCDYDPCSNEQYLLGNPASCCTAASSTMAVCQRYANSSAANSSAAALPPPQVGGRRAPRQFERGSLQQAKQFRGPSREVSDIPPETTGCCVVFVMGFYWAFATSTYLCSMYLAVLTLLAAQIWFQTAACACAQKFKNDRQRFYAERSGHVMLLLWGLSSIYPLYICCDYHAIHGLWGDFWLDFVQVKAFSILFAIVGMGTLWYILWSTQRKTRQPSAYLSLHDEDVIEAMTELDMPFNPLHGVSAVHPCKDPQVALSGTREEEDHADGEMPPPDEISQGTDKPPMPPLPFKEGSDSKTSDANQGPGFHAAQGRASEQQSPGEVFSRRGNEVVTEMSVYSLMGL